MPLGAVALLETLELLLNDNLQPEIQDESLANYAHKLEKKEAEIDWSLSAAEIVNMVRAFNPWPVAYTRLTGKLLRIWQAEPLPMNSTVPPGEIIASSADGIDVAAGAGALRITELQPEGKRRMPSRDFLNAHDLTDCSFG
jgi:methionyl-tRNA formyltransferase